MVSSITRTFGQPSALSAMRQPPWLMTNIYMTERMHAKICHACAEPQQRGILLLISILLAIMPCPEQQYWIRQIGMRSMQQLARKTSDKFSPKQWTEEKNKKKTILLICIWLCSYSRSTQRISTKRSNINSSEHKSKKAKTKLNMKQWHRKFTCYVVIIMIVVHVPGIFAMYRKMHTHSGWTARGKQQHDGCMCTHLFVVRR